MAQFFWYALTRVGKYRDIFENIRYIFDIFDFFDIFDIFDIYTVNHKKGGSTFVIITLEKLDGF